MNPQEARKIFEEADLLCSAEESALAVRRGRIFIGGREPAERIIRVKELKHCRSLSITSAC